MSGMTRRQFIKGATAGAASLAVLGENAFARVSDRVQKQPNLLFVHTDQQHFEHVTKIYYDQPDQFRIVNFRAERL